MYKIVYLEERCDCAFGKSVVIVHLRRALCLCIWTRVVLVYVFTFDNTKEIVKFITDKSNVFKSSVKSDDRAVETGQ
jgi:hypothetical protein